VPGIAQAVVDTYEPVPGTVELVGYYSLRHDTESVEPAEVHAALRERLPPYMAPAYLEQLDVIPMTASNKADRKNLPAPATRIAGLVQRKHAPPASTIEFVLAKMLAESLGVERVSVDSHFFDDLGANSLLMAQFSTRIRRETDLPPVAIKDVYLHPTVRALAEVIDAAEPSRVPTPTHVTSPAAPLQAAHHRQVAAPAVSNMESALRSLLVREGADPGKSARTVRWLAPLRALPPCTRR
jgi:hypothetical protein